MISIAVHSYKGGTGKTNVCINLAAHAAISGKKVCILELDLDAPNLHNLFKNDKGKWINDYLEGRVNLDDVLVDASRAAGKKKIEMKIALANPSIDAVRRNMSADRNQQLLALKRLMAARQSLEKFDYVFIDTSPGVNYSSINAVLSADRIVLISRPDTFDIDGTKRMLSEFYGGLQKKAGLVINRAVGEDGGAAAKSIDMPLLSIIPCYCELAHNRSNGIFIADNPKHEFAGHISKILERTLLL
ncbi:MAG: MinD/ParA family protein [Candidatus Thermoplasmatota archaeon]|nr:MinD/ParA family protein [Candidatus Thermoplasmatota archaeon]